jgi:putative solute:sodium symporter small subunit
MLDVFSAFWVGACGGVIVGIVLSAVFVAVSNRIEGETDK